MMLTTHPLDALETRILSWIKGTTEEDFSAMMLELHAYQFERNASYRRFCQSVNISESITHWRQIPPVPQDAFKFSELRSFPTEETKKVFHTSGTTGEGFGRHFFRTLELYEASILAGWKKMRLPAGPYLVIAPHPSEAPHSSLSHMLATLAPETAFIATGGTIDVSRLRSVSEPTCVLGTALGFLNLFETLGAERLQLPAGSSAMETGGYKGSGRHISRTELYRMFDEKLGILPDQIFNEYSMTELSSQFYSRGPEGIHSSPPWTRVVIADPVTLEEVPEDARGIVIIYDAANTGSVAAIRTQDLAVRHAHGFRLLGRDPSALPRGCSRAADEFFSKDKQSR